MSCFKIIFILTNFFLIITLPIAKAKEPKKVTVATVDNHIITAQDVLNATNRLPKSIREKPLSEIYPKIVNELINQHLITKLAYKDKLDKNREIIREYLSKMDEVGLKLEMLHLTAHFNLELMMNFQFRKNFERV